jgi:hypothetical protein
MSDSVELEVGEMPDGSGRGFALINAQHDGLYRITSPAPASAPTWARRYFGDWRLEVRVPGGWDPLEFNGWGALGLKGPHKTSDLLAVLGRLLDLTGPEEKP